MIATIGSLLVAAGAFAANAPVAQDDFATIKTVLQDPRCQNCHIPGDAPLQFDDSRRHTQGVVRGEIGLGAAGLACGTCHGTANLPDGYGEHVPPGAPNWKLPPPHQKMVFIDLTAAQLCRQIKTPTQTGGKDLDAMFEHISHDPLVLWGWAPGLGRAPVKIPHADFVAAFRRWMDAGAPCPAT